MTMRQRAHDLPAAAVVVQGRAVAEATSNQVDQVGGQVRQIAEGFVTDVLPITNRASKEIGGVDLAFVGPSGCGHMHRPASARHDWNLSSRAADVKSIL